MKNPINGVASVQLLNISLAELLKGMETCQHTKFPGAFNLLDPVIRLTAADLQLIKLGKLNEPVNSHGG